LACFDSVAWNRARSDRIKASRAAGKVHLDAVPRYVETMRGKSFSCVHDGLERGVVRTVVNTGEVVVHWADEYSATKNLATQMMEGKRPVWQSWLSPSDLKDYAFA